MVKIKIYRQNAGFILAPEKIIRYSDCYLIPGLESIISDEGVETVRAGQNCRMK